MSSESSVVLSFSNYYCKKLDVVISILVKRMRLTA
jgi:hypothetical protein